GVKLDALFEQELDLLERSAVIPQQPAALVLSHLGGRGRLALQLVSLLALDLDDVGQPQPKIDDLDLISERVAAAGAKERGRVFETVEVEVVQGEGEDSILAADEVD